MILTKMISIDFNFGSILIYLSGILSGIIIAILIYTLVLILSINKKKKIIEAAQDAIKEEDVREMIEQARNNYRLLIKSDDKEVRESAFLNTIKSLAYNIASKCFPKSKDPLFELSIDESILLLKYIIERVEELLDKKMFWLIKKASLRQIKNIFSLKKKIDNNVVVKEVKKHSKIVKVGLTIINVVKKPVVLLGKSLKNLLINKIMIATIGFVGEESYKIYTKKAIKSMDPEYQKLMEEIDEEIEEIEENTTIETK